MGSLAVKLLPGQLCEALGAKGSTIVFALLSFVVWGINSLWLLSSHVGGFYWLSEGGGKLRSQCSACRFKLGRHGDEEWRSSEFRMS